ncbi:HEAT repeat-containing protein [Peptostreptococcus russellii]|uniref:HEAT repeat-containing protein n=1 Tax=Peptostreptococcus russellii TaxID=215200 RepID=A0A1H8HSJ5_9FIRM|nr:HEAT repeat domain-containing protein [Peptostreptococcus russellii]SEN59094.1 HEAT repeat-containing protein [Peptostreptococcus russellii]
MVIGWENIDDLEDYFITYLLYKKSLKVPQISRIRNKSIEDVNNDLIKAKLSLRKSKKNDAKEKDIINYYLTLSKEERISFIKSLGEEEIIDFKRKVYKGILNLENAEDLMVLVWTAGEFQDSRFLNILYPLTEKNHSNLRRIAYSAIGKIACEESSYILELGLLDKNPQVRQYCAKYLGDIGSMDSIRILENLVKNKAGFEKEYVIRACKASLDKLYQKFSI